MDQLPRLGKRELISLLLFTCNYVVSVWRGFLFLWVLGMGYVILLWHSLSLPCNYFDDIPSMTLKAIKENKRYGRTHARTDVPTRATSWTAPRNCHCGLQITPYKALTQDL